MKYNDLGQSGIKVSELCLGTMTWGSQNSQSDANRQIEISIDHGINFLDTAERRDSIIRLTKLINYRPKRNVPARGLLKITKIKT